MRSESVSSSKRMTTTAPVAAELAAGIVAGRDMALTYGYKSKFIQRIRQLGRSLAVAMTVAVTGN